METFDVEQLRKLVFENKPEVAHLKIEADTDLLDSGAIDSYAIVQLIQLLEERLDIVFDYSDLRAFHFRTLESLHSLLQKKYLPK